MEEERAMYTNTKIFEKGQSRTPTPNSIRTHNGVPVPVVIIGDPGESSKHGIRNNGITE